jgi:hypothetical protein
LAWGSSVSLAVHRVSFISVGYFGQIWQFFSYFLATVPALASVKRPKQVNAPAMRPAERVASEHGHLASR